MTIYVCTASHSMHDDADALVAAGTTRSAAEQAMDKLLNEQTDADFWIVNQAVEVEVVAEHGSDTGDGPNSVSTHENSGDWGQ